MESDNIVLNLASDSQPDNYAFKKSKYVVKAKKQPKPTAKAAKVRFKKSADFVPSSTEVSAIFKKIKVEPKFTKARAVPNFPSSGSAEKFGPSKSAPGKRKDVQSDVFAADRFSSVSGLHKRLFDRLENNDGFGFSRMTTIQKLTIPQLISGKDCFVKSQTGSGKTLAYAVPCIQKLSELEPRIQRQDGPYAIILTPTRELAIQTYEVFERLLKAFIWIIPGYIAGGEKRKSEKARLRKGINVLVCTPGRLTDHLKHTESLSLKNVRWMIYDEADRLLDGGFEADIKTIIDKLRSSRQSDCQSVLLSATLNKNVSQLADLALVDPVFVTPTTTEDGVNLNEASQSTEDLYVLPATLNQAFVVMPVKQRLLTLIALILSKFKTPNHPCDKMLVFLATQDAVDFHYYLLDHVINSNDTDDDETPKKKKRRATVDEEGIASHLEIFRLHGNMSQQERTAVYKEFSAAKKALLLATDVAARGLHIPRLDCIVQYNTPGVAAEYVHRVGRTARMGRSGSAILFLLPSELPYLEMLKEYRIEMGELKQYQFMEILKAEAEVDHLPEALHSIQKRCEDFVYSRKDVYEMANKAFISFVRAYTTYPKQLKPIFNVRSLHLGHLAKCFGLNETPTELAGHRSFGARSWQQHHGTIGSRKRPSQSGDRNRFSAKRTRKIDMSEYGSGFDSINLL